MVDEALHTAFGEARLLASWARDRRCQVPKAVLERRVSDGWDFEFALVTVEREEPAELEEADLSAALVTMTGSMTRLPKREERMEQVRSAAPVSVSAGDIARQLGMSAGGVTQIIAAMPDGGEIRAMLASNRSRRSAQRAAARVKPTRAPFQPSPEEAVELRELVELASKVHGPQPPDAPGRLAAVRRDEIVTAWQLRGAQVREIGQIAGVTEWAVAQWLSPKRREARIVAASSGGKDQQ